MKYSPERRFNMEIPQSHELRKGDEIDLHYTVSGWCKRGKIESLVHQVDQDQRWKITEYGYDEGAGKLRLRVKVVINPFPVVVVVVAVAAVGAGLFAWLSLDKVEMIVSKPLMGLTMLGAVAGGLYFLMKR